MPADEAGHVSIELALVGVGTVESSLSDPALAPTQGDEGAPEATIAFTPEVLPALDGLEVGDELTVVTWLHLARRDVLRVHPRGNLSRPERGVFGTRAPHRPNPIGVHRVKLVALEGTRLRVHGLEAVDGTPVLDVKPALVADVSQR